MQVPVPTAVFLCQYSSIFPKVLTVNANICVIKFLSCRNPKYGEEAKQELIEASGNSSIHLHILDMSLPRAVIAFTQGADTILWLAVAQVAILTPFLLYVCTHTVHCTVCMPYDKAPS